MIAAIIGGGVKLVQLEIAKFTSVSRQAVLAGFGLILLLAGLSVNAAGDAPSAGTDGAQTQGASAAPAQNGAAVQAAPAAAAAQEATKAASASPPKDEPAPATDQADGIDGRWVGNDGVIYGFSRQGEMLVVAARSQNQVVVGQGELRGNQISYAFEAGQCEGTVAADRRTMNVDCVQDGVTYPIELTR